MNPHRLGLLLLFLAQAALFQQYVTREVLWAYPADFDQAAYLFADYSLYRDSLQHGWFAGVSNYLHQPHPTGVMLPLQSALLHFFFGPGRLGNLLLNLGYFVLLQAVFFTTARWLTGRAALGWLGVGLLLLHKSAFFWAGGMLDCRIDFIAYCLYGTFVCLMVRSNALRESRWLAGAAGCALLLVSFRFITFTYLVGFFLTLLTAGLGLRFFHPDRPGEEPVIVPALRRVLALGAGCLAFGAVVILLNWQVIHDYYVVGHLTGSEKHIRAAEMGITSLAGHLTHYGNSLLKDHLGNLFLVVWLALAVGGLAAWAFHRRGTAGAAGAQPATLSENRSLIGLLIIGASIFSPWFILTLNEAKSPVVGNVLAPPVTLLLLALLAGTRRRALASAQPAGPLPGGIFWSVAAAVVLCLGAGQWLDQLSRAGRFTERRASMEQIAALDDYVAEQTARFGRKAPRIAVDVIYDWINVMTLNTYVFERSGRWLEARGSLGAGIFAVPRDKVFQNLAQSDFVLLTDYPKVGPFPFYDSIRPLVPEMRAWCEANLIRGREFQINNGKVTVFIRPGLPIEGLSGEWITPAGVRLRLSGEVLDWMRAGSKRTLVLEGNDSPDWLPTPPVAVAEVRSADNARAAAAVAACPATFVRQATRRYEIRLDLAALVDAGSSPPISGVVIALRLDGAFFVPKAVGVNDDTRELIVTEPDVFRFE